jgi:hypothetical protein
MGGSKSFPSAFLDWLALVNGRLEAIEPSAGETDGICQSRDFARELWRLRRECEVLHQSLGALVQNGQLGESQGVKAGALLHDLRWLLEISPSAPPALARQCVLIAQDRIADEVQAIPDEPRHCECRMMASRTAA